MSEPAIKSEHTKDHGEDPQKDAEVQQQIAPDSLQDAGASGYTLPPGVPVLYSKAEGGVLAKIAWIKRTGADLSKRQVRSPILAAEVLTRHIDKDTRFDYLRDDPERETKVQRWANHPRVWFSGPMHGEDDEVVLLTLRQDQYYLLGLPTGVEVKWDFGAGETFLNISHDALADHGIQSLESMGQSEWKKFAEVVLESLQERTGLEPAPGAVEYLAQVGINPAGFLLTEGETWLLKLTQKDLEKMVGAEKWQAWRKENLAQSGDAKADADGNKDGPLADLTPDQQQIYEDFVEELGVEADDADGHKVTPGVVAAINIINMMPPDLKESIYRHLRSKKLQTTDLTAEALQNAVTDVQVADARGEDSTDNDSEEEDVPPNNVPVEGSLVVPPMAVFAKEDVELGFEVLSSSDVPTQPNITIDWQLIDENGKVTFETTSQHFDGTKRLTNELQFQAAGDVTVRAVVNHSHFRSNVFEEKVQVLPALEAESWMGMALQEVIAYLLEFGEEIAYRIVHFLCEELPDMVVGVILTAYGAHPALHDLIFKATEWLFELASSAFDYLCEMLALIDPEKVGRFVVGMAAIATAPVTASILAGIYLVDPELAIAIIRFVDDAVFGELIHAAITILHPIFVWILDQYWHVGHGIATSTGIGGTVKIFDGDHDSYSQLVRTSEDELTCYYMTTTTLGVAAGANKEKQLDKGPRGKKGKGYNASASADVGAHAKRVEMSEYVFPVLSEPKAFMAFLMTLIGLEEVVSAGSALLESLEEIDAEQWKTRQKLEAGAEANLGLTADVKKTTGGSQKEGNSSQTEGRGDLGTQSFWQRLFGLKGGGDVSAFFGWGVGVELGDIDRSKQTATVTIYGEINAFVRASAMVPVLGDVLRFVPQIDGGVGVRARYRIFNIEQDPTFRGSPKVSVYLKRGDLDRFDTAGSDVDFQLDNLEDIRSYDDFLAALKETTIQHRFFIPLDGGRKYLKNKRLQEKFRSRLPESQKNVGAESSAIVEILIRLQTEDLKTILNDLIVVANDPGKAIAALEALVRGEDVPAEVGEIVELLVANLEKATLRLGIGIGGSFSTSDLDTDKEKAERKALESGGKKGAKRFVRARASAKAEVMKQEDITDMFKGSPGDLQALLYPEQAAN